MHLPGLPSGSAASFGSERSFKSEADATEDAAAFRQVGLPLVHAPEMFCLTCQSYSVPGWRCCEGVGSVSELISSQYWTDAVSACVQVRHLRKKLQQIEALEARASEGEALNPQQAAKVAQRPQVRVSCLRPCPAVPVGTPSQLSSHDSHLFPWTKGSFALCRHRLSIAPSHPGGCCAGGARSWSVGGIPARAAGTADLSQRAGQRRKGCRQPAG